MNKDEIIRMAQEAGMVFDGVNTRVPLWISKPEELERFVTLVAAAEREACAQICEKYYTYYGYQYMADDIRARGAP